MVHPTTDVPAPKPQPILNDDDEDIQLAEEQQQQQQQAPPATILSSPVAGGESSTPPQKPAVDITMPPILPIPPESSAAADDLCGTDMAAPGAAAPDGEGEEQSNKLPGKEELGRSQSSSGTADSGQGAGAASTAKYGAAQSSMPRNFRLSLDGYVLQNDKDGKYAAYRISVTAGLHTWLVLRRCVFSCPLPCVVGPPAVCAGVCLLCAIKCCFWGYLT